MPRPRHCKGPRGRPRFRREGSGGERFLGEIISPGPHDSGRKAADLLRFSFGSRREGSCGFMEKRSLLRKLCRSDAFWRKECAPGLFLAGRAGRGKACRTGCRRMRMLRPAVFGPPLVQACISSPLTQADSVPAFSGPSYQRKGFQEGSVAGTLMHSAFVAETRVSYRSATP